MISKNTSFLSFVPLFLPQASICVLATENIQEWKNIFVAGKK